MDEVWLDVQMWTGLQGNFHPFIDVACEAPDPLPAAPAEWQQWADGFLGLVAQQEGWQPGRYHYTAEQRDDAGHIVQVFARGLWEWNT